MLERRPRRACIQFWRGRRSVLAHLTYLRERKQFERVIGSFQCSFSIAPRELYCDIELSRAMELKALQSLRPRRESRRFAGLGRQWRIRCDHRHARGAG